MAQQEKGRGKSGGTKMECIRKKKLKQWNVTTKQLKQCSIYKRKQINTKNYFEIKTYLK